MIKTALMLERGFILPNYDFKYPNEKIPFDEWGMKVATRQQPWPFGKKWASVNGFGFGGTNGHVVVSVSHAVLHSWRSLTQCIPDDQRSA